MARADPKKTKAHGSRYKRRPTPTHESGRAAAVTSRTLARHAGHTIALNGNSLTMLSISIGPLAFPLAPLPVLLALLLSAWVARRMDERAETAVWISALAGLLAARLGHLAMHADAYLATPGAMLDIRDGGWNAAAGWAVAAAVLAWRAAAVARLRPALVSAAVAGLVIGVGGQLALQLATPDRRAQPAPAVALLPLAAAEATPSTLADLVRGQPTVVNLWATWCAPCRAEMPMLAAAQQRHADVRFLFVNQGEEAAVVNRYLQREALPLRDVWLDAPRGLGAAVQSSGLPTTLFYDAQGRLVDAHMGLLNAAALRARLQALRED